MSLNVDLKRYVNQDTLEIELIVFLDATWNLLRKRKRDAVLCCKKGNGNVKMLQNSGIQSFRTQIVTKKEIRERYNFYGLTTGEPWEITQGILEQ